MNTNKMHSLKVKRQKRSLEEKHGSLHEVLDFTPMLVDMVLMLTDEYFYKN